MGILDDTMIAKQESSLRKRVKTYKRATEEIKVYLDQHPHEWGRFQSRINMEINGIFQELMDFERRNLLNNNEDNVYKLKRLFINHLRRYFLFGDLIKKSLEKPYGYAGDFSIIDDIYRNEPQTLGIDRLFDNYFQMSAICHTVRNRKNDFKNIILKYIKENKTRKIRVMDLASGPCRDAKEVLDDELCKGRDVSFDCYDQDERAFVYAKGVLSQNLDKVRFVKDNVVRIALRKNVQEHISTKYDIIYSTGLFDYLDKRIATKLIANLRQLLNPGGIMAISDVRDKFSNPSIYYMEWVADWNLIYRSDDEYVQIFLDAGFKQNNLKHDSEQQGILQYIIASQE